MADEILFTAEKPALSAALAVVKDAVNHGAKIPILTHLLLARQGDGRMQVTGSNLDQEIRAAFPAVTGESFEAFACPARTLFDVVSNAPDLPISIHARRNPVGRLDGIEIRFGKFRTRLQVLPAKDFPSIDVIRNPQELSLNSASLARALKAVHWAAETNVQRFAYCGVHLDMTDAGLSVVATDRNRMALRIIPRGEFDQDDIDRLPAITVPNKAVSLLLGLLECSEDVVLDISRERLCATAGNARLITKLVDEPFVPYRELKPSKEGQTVQLGGADLAASVARVLRVDNDKVKAIAFDIREDSLKLYSNDGAGNEAHDEIEVSATGPIRHSFNGDNLLKALKAIGRDDIELVIGRPKEVAVVRSPSDPNTAMMFGPIVFHWVIHEGPDGLRWVPPDSAEAAA
jgi:DNA polymerase III beta subunit